MIIFWSLLQVRTTTNHNVLVLCSTIPDTEEDSTGSSSPGFESSPVIREETHYYPYILVGDNVDKTIRPRHMTMDKQTQSIHYFQFYGVQDRINFRHLQNEGPIGSVSDLPMSAFLPDLHDCSVLRDNYATLMARELIKKLPYFKIFEDCVPMHIPHEYSEQMCKKSVLVGLDVRIPNVGSLNLYNELPLIWTSEM